MHTVQLHTAAINTLDDLRAALDRLIDYRAWHTQASLASMRPVAVAAGSVLRQRTCAALFNIAVADAQPFAERAPALSAWLSQWVEEANAQYRELCGSALIQLTPLHTPFEPRPACVGSGCAAGFG